MMGDAAPNRGTSEIRVKMGQALVSNSSLHVVKIVTP